MSKRPKPRTPVKPKFPTAAFAYIHPGEVSNAFAYCMARLLVYEVAQGRMPPIVISQRCASGQLVEARNETAAFFLDKTDAEWFMCVDSDMGFDADTLEQLILSADRDTRPFVGALCFGLKKDGDEDSVLQSTHYRQFPTIYQWSEREEDGKVAEVGFVAAETYPDNALVEVNATGAACFVVHRWVLEKMRERVGDHWFDKVRHPMPEPEGTRFSEDLSFCIRANQVGASVWVNTGVKTSHDKGGIFLDEFTYARQMAADLIVDKHGQLKVDPVKVRELCEA